MSKSKDQRKRLAAIRAIAPLAVPMTDDELGMAWWNAASEQERARWAKLAGTGRAKDAWELKKASLITRSENLLAASHASHYS